MNQTIINNPICYAKVVNINNLWGDIPPLEQPIPKLMLQMTSAMVVNHGLLFIFQRLRQPRILCDIVTALVLSPSTLNKINKNLGTFVFPHDSITILETISNLGLLYAMFIQGLHADLTPIAHKRINTTCFACFAFIAPFLIGCVLYFVFRRFCQEENNMHNVEVGTLYWGIINTATSFETLAPILANVKIFCTNLGREALSLGLLNDVLTWVLVQFSLAISTSSASNYHHIHSPSTWWVILFMVLYMIFCAYVIKPIFSNLSGNVSTGEKDISDAIVQIIMFLALACGFLANYFGSHFIFAAFVLGTSIPTGVITETLIQKIEDCTLGVLMPLYFALMGTKIDVNKLVICLKYSWIIVIGVISKALFTLPSAFLCKVSTSNGFALGILLSVKGLLPVVILNIGHDRGHLTDESYALLLVILILSTILAGPLGSIWYVRFRKKKHPYHHKTLEDVDSVEEVRVFTCIHDPQAVYNIINLLEISNISSKPFMSVFALHLVELVGHASPIVVEHESRNSSISKPFFRRARNISFQIIKAFYEYEDIKGAVGSVQVFTIISPIGNIHEDICSLAEDNQASLIILPFHVHQGVDCKIEDGNSEFGVVNRKVMSVAPCSVALLIDRGLRTFSIPLASSSQKSCGYNIGEHTQITMVYIGGPDDREALTYATRMARNPFVTLTIIRFNHNKMDFYLLDGLDKLDTNEGQELLAIRKQIKHEKERDNEFLHILRQNIVNDKSIHYIEKLANTGDEVVSILSDMQHDCDLYVIGKGQSRVSPLTAKLEDWSEYKELGPLGDLLVTSDYCTKSSVLVVQKYNKDASQAKRLENLGDEDHVFTL